MPNEHRFGQLPSATPTLELIEQLHTHRRIRDTHGLYFVEGVRNFIAAVDYRAPIATIVYSERLLTAPIARKLVRQVKRAGVPYLCLTPEAFRSISRTERASGVGAILRQQVHPLAAIDPSTQPCWIAVRQVRAPGNLGTLVRTAAAVGVSGFLVLGNGIDPYDPAVLRASMGAFFGQPFIRTSLSELRSWVNAHGIQVVGASPDGTHVYTDAPYRKPLILLLGEERAGLTADERALCDQLVRIPMRGGTDSLNLGVAGSLLLYEVFRGTG
jgi:RNA methyltransferase, TrmH family